MFISNAALALTASFLVWVLAFLLFIVALRRRWFGRYVHGFFYSVAVAVAGAAMMSAMVVGRWGFITAKETVDREVASALENVASVVDGQVLADLRQMRTTLEELAHRLAPAIGRASATELRARLDDVHVLIPRYLQLRVVSPHGDILATSDDVMPEAMNRVAVAYALDGAPYVSEAFSSKAYKSEVVALAVPVKDAAGAVIAVVTAVFDLQSMLEELVSGSRFNQSGFAVVVDGDGDVVAHPDRARLGSSVQQYEAVQRAWATRGSGSVVGRNAAGTERLFFFRAFRNPSTVGRQPWVLMTEVDAAEELAVLRRLQRELYAGILVLLVISLVLAQQIAASVESPLGSLKHLAARLGRGELDARSDVTGRDLAGSLAASLDTMAAGLRERDRVKEVFGRYIATQVSDRILKGDVNLGGESREVTILFSDIRNFTSMSEEMAPQQVVAFLNDYFSEMVEAVFEQGGVLDKFLGDGMMAVFGSLGDQPDHALRAVRAATRMKALLGKINGERAMTGKPPIAIGVGIHTAEVIVGNIGSTRRLEYTVIGDGVNTSSRVQALNKEFGTTILITETTYEAVKGEFECRAMPETRIRGKQRALRFYEVVSAIGTVAA
ncbi:MAG TPA: adenylate/guanylate cyclase domain-containing protein [Vicinamibacterales bacterium]|nr:adenylate/guanylate cyclase domain-containing protein [Vicinamibacterales bacterium]